MKRVLAVPLLLLLLACPAPAQAPVEIKTQPGRLVKLSTDAKAESIAWDSPSEAVDLIESETGKWAIFACLVPGRYRVSAWACVAGKVQRVGWYVVIVGGDVPPPIPPPPPPPPLPPEPTDDLFQALKAAWVADGKPAGVNKELAAVYTQAVRQTLPDAATPKALIDAMHRAVDAHVMIGPNRLVNVRKVLKAELNRRFPTPENTPMTAELRNRHAEQFGRIAYFLENLP